MYSSYPTFVFGFHGCDRKTADSIITTGSSLHCSNNDYDWLGHGIYFWENNPQRALEWANDNIGGKYEIETPDIIGAIIDLRNCLNLLDSKFLQLIKNAYELFRESYKTGEIKDKFPENHKGARRLDCAVIESLHQSIRKNNLRPFDTVRAVFTEGKDLYPGAGFQSKSHIQICVTNPNCIKGYFRKRELT